MSRFSSALIIGSSIALFSLGAPVAFAQPAPADMSSVAASQLLPGAATSKLGPIDMHFRHRADRCFTEDLVPDDDSSMLTVCGTDGPSTVIFSE